MKTVLGEKKNEEDVFQRFQGDSVLKALQNLCRIYFYISIFHTPVLSPHFSRSLRKKMNRYGQRVREKHSTKDPCCFRIVRNSSFCEEKLGKIQILQVTLSVPRV